MAHHTQFIFIELLAKYMPRYFCDAKVLEIGSLDINGSIRQFFDNCDYTGIDVAAGKGVDVVCQGQEYRAPDGSFDHVISCECMEHNPFWKETYTNMIRLCRPGGLVTMTCATIGRLEHGTDRTNADASPLTIEIGWKYYKNLVASDFKRCITHNDCFDSYRFWTNWSCSDLYFTGIRSSKDALYKLNEWIIYEQAVNALIRSSNDSINTRLRKYVGCLFGDYGLSVARRLDRVMRRHS